MDFITYAQDLLMAQLPAIIAQYDGDHKAKDLSEMETAIKQMTHTVGNALLQHWVEAQDQPYPDDQKPCPACGQPADYVRRRQGMSMTLQGRLYYRRSYYVCGHCHQGFYPLDQALAIHPGEMSAEVVKLAALFGVQDAFGTSRDQLLRTTLLDLSPNSIRKATQQIGQQVEQHEQQLHQHSQSLGAQCDPQHCQNPPQRLYGSMDGFRVLLDDGWHEMKAGAWWTTTTQRNGDIKAEAIDYYVDLLPAPAFADLVWATGFERQADQALELVFVADAAEWIWNIVDQHYPQAIQIVDWFHACAYLALVAKVAFADPHRQAHWLAQVTDDLWAGRLDAVIAACAAHIDPQRLDDPAQQAVTYYTNNRHRMDYATYRAQGYQIGSGSMESGCKQLGLARLKIAGARWSAEGAKLVAKARAAYLSGQWDELNAYTEPLPQVA